MRHSSSRRIPSPPSIDAHTQRANMPKNPTKNYDLDEDQYTRSFNKADDSPKSWICRDADCAYENENMEDEECEACGEARYEELVDRARLRVEPTRLGRWLTVSACRPLPAQSTRASSAASSRVSRTSQTSSRYAG